MKSQKKISLTLLFVMSIVFLAMLGIITYDLKYVGLRGAHDRADAVANIVKFGLTAHMVNGTMDKRAAFIQQVETLEQMNDIWILRAPLVVRQYGTGLHNEEPRDDIDRWVVESGVKKVDYQDSLFGPTTYRVTIPYKAEQNGAINCLDCHDAKVGDTLGAISIEMNMDDLKRFGLSTVAYTMIIAFGLIVFIQIFVNRLVGPYFTIFDSIKNVMKKTQEGDYSQRVEIVANQDGKEVAQWINALLEKLQSTLNEIQSKIDVFLTQHKKISSDPLFEVKNAVNRLSDIYRFRKAIEHDEDITEVYQRLASVLRSKFGLENFNLIEADTTNKAIGVVHMEQDIMCQIVDGCRSDRSNTIVDSCQFENMCGRMNGDVDYLCTPYSISNDLDLILSIVTENEEETKRVRMILPSVSDYIDAVKPEIVSKKLTQQLERSARTDPLTGLYNRKYLEESIEKIVHQAQRSDTPYGILMADIDHFKMVNDTYGHDVGDEAIRTIAATLEENIRESDIVVRFGGEEFVVLLYNCNGRHITDVAEKIRSAFAKKTIRSNGVAFKKTISIGASLYPEQSTSFWKCIKYADVALYHAKQNGRNKAVLFDPSIIREGELEHEY